MRSAIQGSLGAARAELQAELQSARAERASIIARLDASPSRRVRSDLQARLEQVDARIEKLESGVVALDARFGPARETFASTAPAAQVSFPPPPDTSFNPAPMVIAVMAILFIGFPLALTFARLMWRRATGATTPPAAVTAETTRRFDRLEQSVDAIAIEIERISENQRYLTKVLSEGRQGAAVGSGEKV
ncbi:MAG TPA: hypothetical protein VFO55_05335 [Gemmatimonadaceae bacterium]|nr:hypothetical protein [Gemmatimonadaceae bacterium]